MEEGRIDIPICVTYNVYEGDSTDGEAVSSGWALTGPDVDYTVKVCLAHQHTWGLARGPFL